MRSRAVRLLKGIGILLAAMLATLLAARAYQSLHTPPLQLWHTWVPHDMTARTIATADWAGYVRAEDALFDQVRIHVTDKLDAQARNPANRYFDGSPLYPGRFRQDWNRSYILAPSGVPTGAVVLLHGLTDSPYSLRHVAQRYRQDGYVAVAIRLPGHGTVPSGLTDAVWEDWAAATRLAVLEASRRAGENVPLHVVGYSSGGALAVHYALEALGDAGLPRPDRVVLISPMIGITRLARFAG